VSGSGSDKTINYVGNEEPCQGKEIIERNGKWETYCAGYKVNKYSISFKN